MPDRDDIQAEQEHFGNSQAREIFAALDRSIWVRLQIPDQLSGDDSAPRLAIIELPDDGRLRVTITAEGGLRLLKLERQPEHWAPMSVVVFSPAKAVEDETCLYASEFKRVVGEDLESLPLSPVAGAPHSFTLSFRSQAQQVLWQDRKAFQMIRFEPRKSR